MGKWAAVEFVEDWRWLGEGCEALAARANGALSLPSPHPDLLTGEDANVDPSSSPHAPLALWDQSLVIQFRHRQKPIRVASIKIVTQPYRSSPSVPTPNTASESPSAHVKSLVIEFETPQRGVTPGQSAAIWLAERCLGGGVIQRCIQWGSEERSAGVQEA